ncbi:MAG: hypothetical protein Q9195_001845 [Heterodermia aff. obscurata]
MPLPDQSESLSERANNGSIWTNQAQDQYAQKYALRSPQNNDANCSHTGTQVGGGPASNDDDHIPSSSEISLTRFAAPHSEVSSFCCAVLSQVIPADFWGDRKDGLKNKNVIMRRVDQFVRLRKFETLSLHNIFQGIKITSITWLSRPGSASSGRIAASDLDKRKEIYLEFLYYIFDSFLIPLIRSNFHVTESGTHRNRLFYFRHDIWRAMTEPALTNLKLSTFQEIPTVKALRVLDARALGFSQVRLLPKAQGVRPIINLRRRVNRIQGGKSVLGRSINSAMQPVFCVLDYESRAKPASIGSALRSVGDMHTRLKTFRSLLIDKKQTRKRLFFAKCDVRACFDTLPQRLGIEIARTFMEEDEYKICRHAEMKASNSLSYGTDLQSQAKCIRKHVSRAQAMTDFQHFSQTLKASLAKGKKNTVFVDGVLHYNYDRDKLMALLAEHVQNNVIKIGKKFYKQEAGIPQGSVLSNLLCNFVYAKLEKEYLDFLREDESMLLRLVDDFLLISTNEGHAKKFLQIMHAGIRDFGVQVNPTKSIVNFEAFIDGAQIPIAKEEFPYCGNLINTKTLEITKDRQRRKDTGNILRL